MLNFLGSNLVGLLGILLGFFGLIIFLTELRYRRKLAENELVLQRKQFDAKEKERERKENWLETQNFTLKEMSSSLSENIAAQLRRDCSWASEAFERTKLGPYAETLFGERKNHFREEKELIAEKFSLLLIERFKWLFNQQRCSKLYLCIDSGTTLYPIFKNLGTELAKEHRRGEKWIKDKKLTIVTNNLPGIETLMEHGRINPANRFSSLAVDCQVLPGMPLPIYSAVTGENTEIALQEIKTHASKDSIFIGLTTGNWVRIRRNHPRCPVPLSRGGRHPEFKQKLIDICNELYVVSPLGKIFAEMSEKEVNEMLNLKKGSPDQSKKPYKEGEIDSIKAENVKLVSSRREQGRLLSSLSNHLGGQLGTLKIEGNDDSFIQADLGKTMHIQFYFDLLPKDKYLEKEFEFPHSHTRKNSFIERFINP
jgi:hypothetical protein